MNNQPVMERSTVSEFAAELEDTLRRAEQFGIACKGTRFDKYLRLLQEAVHWQFPLSLSDEQRDRLAERFFEAASQAQQLIRSAPTWDEVERKVLLQKLEKVFNGAESPPPNGRHDEPRNTLLELVTAGLLKHSGFGVSLSTEEDVVATLPGAEFAVECKRPGNLRRLQDSLRDIRDQLIRRRRQHPQRIGIAVVGIDRLIGIIGRSPHTRDLESLRSFLEGQAQQVTLEIDRLVPKTRLRTQAQFGCVVLATAIFVESEKVLARAHQFSGFSLERGDTGPLAKVFAARFGRTIEVD